MDPGSGLQKGRSRFNGFPPCDNCLGRNSTLFRNLWDLRIPEAVLTCFICLDTEETHEPRRHSRREATDSLLRMRGKWS